MRYALGIGLSAFLLFQVQPLSAASILPWFGGASSVWTTCLLFFQSVLLAGYAYAFWLGERSVRTQRLVHGAVLLGSLVVLPILPDPSLAPLDATRPVQRVLVVLALTVGLPYFLLSTTGPLLQHWFAARYPDRDPYRLYALSNAASLAGLLTYPLLVQPFFELESQAWAWSAGYALYAVAVLWVLRELRVSAPSELAEVEPPGAVALVRWVLLAGTGTALLMATTNQLTQDVASVPFLWVLPLAIYLGSLIVAFDRPSWYHRVGWMGALFAATVPLGPWAEVLGWDGLFVQAPALCLLLAAGCMMVHGELVRGKPAARHLTRFYLAMSLGGALGGLCVAVLAPLAFPTFFEFPLAVTAAFVLWAWRPGVDEQLRPVQTIAMTVGFWYLPVGLGGAQVLALMGSAATERSFYGVLKVVDDEVDGVAVRKMRHGRILHGLQLRDDPRAPTTYYGPDSGVGLSMARVQAQGPAHVGLVGLGAGTLATYGRSEDALVFYELDPHGVEMAQTWFTYLEDSPASIELRLGDARLALEREAPDPYDLLVVDAFSGDAIPVHLLTEEAFALYAARLAEDGLLALHVSNMFLELEIVAAAGAASAGLSWVVVRGEEQEPAIQPSRWLVAARDPELLAGLPSMDLPERRVLWTDSYSSLVSVLR